MRSTSIFVLETRPQFESQLNQSLLDAGFKVIRTASAGNLLSGLRAHHGQVVVLGPSQSLRMEESLELVRNIRESYGSIPVILVVANSSEEYAIGALRAGVNEYVRFPFAAEELVLAARRSLRLVEAEREQGVTASGTNGIIGESSALREIQARIERLAPNDSNVLITGESGTGKELFAKLVHEKSRRRSKPFVAINCAAIPDSLLESELFGHTKGAFTGADSVQDGKFKAADQGSLFLDEIGDMSLYSQAKILRVLENREIQRLGCSRGIPVNVRMIAATNQDLEQLSRENKFRPDLYFRLNVAHLHLPPLRERKDDLPALVDHYLDLFSAQFRYTVPKISDEALDCMFAYDWPGNIRELKNLLESILAEGPRPVIALHDLPARLRGQATGPKAAQDERGRLLWALAATNWNKSKAAAKLEWSRMTLYRKMDRYNILREPAVAGSGAGNS